MKYVALKYPFELNIANAKIKHICPIAATELAYVVFN